MFISEPKTFDEAIKPLVYLNWFVGMGAFRRPNQSGTIYLFMNLYTIFVTLFNCAMIYFTLSSIAQVIDYDNASPMAITMYKTLIRANSCMTVLAPVLVWLQRKGARDCLRGMANFDDTYQVVLGVRTEYRKQYIRLVCQIIAILLIMSLVGIYDTVWSLEIELQMNSQSVLLFSSVAHSLHYPILVLHLLDLNFRTFLGYLEKKFRDLNDSLLRLADKVSTTRPGGRLFVISRNFIKTTLGNGVRNTETEGLIIDKHYSLREIRKAHLKLCILSRKLNLAFGIQNLLTIGISFVMITGLLYTIYSAFSWDTFTTVQLKEVIPSVTWIAMYAFKIWTVNHSCWKVSSEAERTGEVIYELLNSRMEKELQNEIQEFGVQMLHNTVRFNACGFFSLDYTFVQGVIGSITTYLVILIQMNQVSKPTNWNPLINYTKI